MPYLSCKRAAPRKLRNLYGQLLVLLPLAAVARLVLLPCPQKILPRFAGGRGQILPDCTRNQRMANLSVPAIERVYYALRKHLRDDLDGFTVFDCNKSAHESVESRCI